VISNQEEAAEANNALDALSALSVELACHHREAPPDRLVLPARKLRDACEKIDAATGSLKRILRLALENGQGPSAAPSPAQPRPGGDK